MNVLRPHPTRSGFTLAEAAITIALVGLTITYTLQALTSAQTTAAHTHEVKLAREMALRTLGEIATGQYQAESTEVIVGTYPEDIAPYMSYQIAFGDASLPDHGQREDRDVERIDNWANRRQWEQNNQTSDEETVEEDYETVHIRVIFPKHSEELNDSIELEAWIPWEQVHGKAEADVTATDTATEDGSGAAGGSAGGDPGGTNNAGK
ncbi:MAG: hypothetical protein H6830_05115 [Planctomycetes bacterium]|nr:hypothetical protein [Planctomycetota bacterium]MCB9909202.1 hypothetical protein [Planctomycetota bacterium]MCB9913316.1 hypothetical protein [Planctomycetota bacterium]HRV81317.1 hypothetical protein [Planctomycetota bacterium]